MQDPYACETGSAEPLSQVLKLWCKKKQYSQYLIPILSHMLFSSRGLPVLATLLHALGFQESNMKSSVFIFEHKTEFPERNLWSQHSAEQLWKMLAGTLGISYLRCLDIIYSREASHKHNRDTGTEYKLANRYAQIPVPPSNSRYFLQYLPLTSLGKLLRDRAESTLVADRSEAILTEECQHEHKVKNIKIHSGSLLPGWHVVLTHTRWATMIYQGTLGQTSMC